MQKQIVEIAQDANIRIIGPNCMGVTNFNNGFSSGDLEMDNSTQPVGKTATIAQSGVIRNIFIDWASIQYIGFSKAVKLGNKIDVDEIDMIKYFKSDSETNIITIYLEGTKRGKELIEILKNINKSVLILKSGKTKSDRNAVPSHTGSIAGDDKIYEAVINYSPGVYRIDDFYEMINIAHIFSTQPLPGGKNVAVITGSGSLGILTCDQIQVHKLKVPQLSQNTVQKIKSVIPG
ncbi:MAG: hypothetical protein GF383_05790 [Candidatus Lokiarchaeota archaeon]|nr:hypothetical protein [Candidatus Lokiarchaeota archaeon]MBD3339443.1 hypothetical protein [Candidatus Lokiarchaeota archaeon]